MDDSGICYLCFKPCDPRKFRDHVPPKGCFPEKTEDLITVCCCEACNKGNSRADEFFRVVTALQPHPTKTNLEVWKRIEERTIGRGRIRKELNELRATISQRVINGAVFGEVLVKGRPIRLQMIRITKGLLRHFYPNVDYRELEWQVVPMNPFKLKKSAEMVRGKLHYHGTKNQAYQVLFGIAHDKPDSGMWFHVFHGGHGYLVAHGPRGQVRKKYKA